MRVERKAEDQQCYSRIYLLILLILKRCCYAPEILIHTRLLKSKQSVRLETARTREENDCASVNSESICWDQIPSCEGLKWSLSAHIYSVRTWCKWIVFWIFSLLKEESSIFLSYKVREYSSLTGRFTQRVGVIPGSTVSVLILCCNAADILLCVPEPEIAIYITTAWKRWKNISCQ